jgi:tetratricopeptide (TPR) repeat protein
MTAAVSPMSNKTSAATPNQGMGARPSFEAHPALVLLEHREYEAAVLLLQQLIEEEPSAENHGLLGTAYLLLDKYAEARQHLELALKKDPANKEWADKLETATTNLISEVQEEFPQVLPYEREALLAPPQVPEGALPQPPPPKPATAWDSVRGAIGTWSGKLIEVLKAKGTALFGKNLSIADEVWTNWYHKPTFLALLTLSRMRDQLSKLNLKDTYPPGERTAFQSPELVPPPEARYFRTADGSWNNLSNPKEGAAGVRFPRNVDRAATWPEDGAALLSPNPAEISQLLFTRDEMKPVPFLNLLAGAWIQFMVHDWVSHRMSTRFGVHEIPLPPDHPARSKYHQTKMFVGKTSPDPTRMPQDEGTAPTYINDVTSWWDASQLYGSDWKTASSLRSHQDGKLRLDERGLLPLGKSGVEEAGFNQNWWVGLTLLHTLFVKEHNAICDMLKAHYPEWDDNRLYNVARLINAAVLAKIHTVEWTPAILPNRVLYYAMNANWYGLVETFTRRRKNRKALRSIKIASSEVGGIVGNPTEKHDAPYGLSEEFTEVYRLHELLPDMLEIRSLEQPLHSERVPLAQVRQAGSHKLTDRVPMGDLIFSFGKMHPGALVLNNYPRAMRELSLPGNPVYDLAAVDILRARERGVPRYNEFRRQLGLKPIRTFEDLTDDKDQLEKLRSVYKDVEEIDLLVGNRAEAHRPDWFGFGETLFQVFILNASRRLQADRFFTESFTEETYTPEGLQWIDDSDFKAVLLRHHPKLAQTGLAGVTNAFEPWDTDEGLNDPMRHPLRAFDL